MAAINITDSKGRDAEVAAESVAKAPSVRWIDPNETQAENRKILRGTAEHDLDKLLEKAGGLDEVAELLIGGDPEVDVERFGCFLGETSRVYVDKEGEVVHRVTRWEVVRNPDGSEKERRPMVVAEPNVSSETPLKWTGKLMKKSEAARRFVFSGKMQIQHVNGLTHDFLRGIAEELAEKESMMLLAGGPKGNLPLVFRRGGLAYRGFLEGRIDGDRYALVLHLTNMEFKVPPPPDDESDGGDTKKAGGKKG